MRPSPVFGKVCCILFLLPFFVHALSADSGIIERQSKSYSAYPELLLFPADWKASSLHRALEQISPNESLELFYRVKLPGSWAGGDTKAKELLVQAMLEISRLDNLPYPGQENEEKPEILFHEAYVVKEVGDLLPSYNPVYHPEADGYQFIAYLDDNDYGDLYLLVNVQRDQRISVVLHNGNRISYGFVPLVSPGSMVLYIECEPAEEEILLYAVAAIDAPGAGLLGSLVRRQLRDRLEAMVAWLIPSAQP